MEARLGSAFDGVRIHTDANAARSAGALNAQAYTVGQDIVFGTGRYSPGTAAGNRLLAHELVHTVQQSHTSSAASPARSSVEISSPGEASELEAHSVAQGALSGFDRHEIRERSHGIQREPDTGSLAEGAAPRAARPGFGLELKLSEETKKQITRLPGTVSFKLSEPTLRELMRGAGIAPASPRESQLARPGFGLILHLSEPVQKEIERTPGAQRLTLPEPTGLPAKRASSLGVGELRRGPVDLSIPPSAVEEPAIGPVPRPAFLPPTTSSTGAAAAEPAITGLKGEERVDVQADVSLAGSKGKLGPPALDLQISLVLDDVNLFKLEKGDFELGVAHEPNAAVQVTQAFGPVPPALSANIGITALNLALKRREKDFLELALGQSTFGVQAGQTTFQTGAQLEYHATENVSFIIGGNVSVSPNPDGSAEVQVSGLTGLLIHGPKPTPARARDVSPEPTPPRLDPELREAAASIKSDELAKAPGVDLPEFRAISVPGDPQTTLTSLLPGLIDLILDKMVSGAAAHERTRVLLLRYPDGMPAPPRSFQLALQFIIDVISIAGHYAPLGRDFERFDLTFFRGATAVGEYHIVGLGRPKSSE